MQTNQEERTPTPQLALLSHLNETKFSFGGKKPLIKTIDSLVRVSFCSPALEEFTGDERWEMQQALDAIKELVHLGFEYRKEANNA